MWLGSGSKRLSWTLRAQGEGRLSWEEVLLGKDCSCALLPDLLRPCGNILGSLLWAQELRRCASGII